MGIRLEKVYRIIGAASGWGEAKRECEQGPEALKKAELFENLTSKGSLISGWETLYPEKRAIDSYISLAECLPIIHHFNHLLAKSVVKSLEKETFPIVIGGDHSIAVGTWNGVRHFLLKQNPLLPMGLIWIDAHMDAHTPETTPSGMWCGMPLAGLLGYGNQAFSRFELEFPVLQPKHVCLIGIRSFELEEEKLLKSLGVRIFYDSEVKKRGLDAVMKEAISLVSEETIGFGVSLDLDVVDPSEAPGVGCPVENGIISTDLIAALKQLRKHSNFVAFELVEFNPHRDLENKTLNLCFEIIETITGKYHG